jgi:hypothetical protein
MREGWSKEFSCGEEERSNSKLDAAELDLGDINTGRRWVLSTADTQGQFLQHFG